MVTRHPTQNSELHSVSHPYWESEPSLQSHP